VIRRARTNIWLILTGVMLVALLAVSVIDDFLGDVDLWAVSNTLQISFGLLLAGVSLRAMRYFRRQQQLMGSNWVLKTFERSCQTTAVISAWFTTARVIFMIVGPGVWWASLLSGMAFVWLLIIPALMQREFELHEGR
jgi:hypothetical protein